MPPCRHHDRIFKALTYDLALITLLEQSCSENGVDYMLYVCVGYRDILKVLSCCAFRLFLALSFIGVKLSINSFHYLAQFMLNRPAMYA